MSVWLTAEQYETLNAFAPEFTGFLLLVMDANIATAKNIYEAQRTDLKRLSDRIVMLQEEVDELRRTCNHLMEELQTVKLESRL